MKNKPEKIFALLLSFVLLLSACGANDPMNSDPVGQSGDPQAQVSQGGTAQGNTGHDDIFVRQTEEGTLTVGQTFGIFGYDPKSVSTNNMGFWLVYDTVLTMDYETLEPLPGLAESWDYSDDKLTLQLNMRDDVYFSNGEKMTGEDVLFSMERVKAGMYSWSVNAIDFDKSYADGQTVVLKFDYPFTAIMTALTTNTGMVLCKSYVEAAGDDAFWDAPVGTGPYVLTENVSGSHATFTRKTEYWGEQSEAETITLRYYGDPNTMFIDYETGAVDAIFGVSQADLQRVMDGEVPNTTYVLDNCYNLSAVAVTSQSEYFQNQKVREALAYAIDVDALCQASYGIYGTTASSIVPENSQYYTSVGIREYNPDKAVAMIKEAGFNPEDISFDCYIMANEYNTIIATGIQALLDQIGIDMEVFTIDMASFTEQVVSGDVDVCIHGLADGSYTAAMALTHLQSTSTNASVSLKEEDVNELIMNALRAANEEDAQKYYTAVQEWMYEQCYQIPICTINGAYVCRDYIDDISAMTPTRANLAKTTFVK